MSNNNINLPNSINDALEKQKINIITTVMYAFTNVYVNIKTCYQSKSFFLQVYMIIWCGKSWCCTLIIYKILHATRQATRFWYRRAQIAVIVNSCPKCLQGVIKELQGQITLIVVYMRTNRVQLGKLIGDTLQLDVNPGVIG